VKRAVTVCGLERAGIQVEIECTPSDTDVLVNREQLYQVLTSVFAAELDALKASVAERRVGIRLARQAGLLVLSMRTNSPEISADDLSRLLSPVTLRNPQRFGKGISFAVCMQIARDHDGTFSVGNRGGGGREYVLELPAFGPAEKPTSSAGRPPASGSIECHLLVIDDDPRVLESYELMVRHLGYSLEAVQSGEEALQLLGRKSFDALVLDLHLGGAIDGIDVIEELQRAYPDLLAHTLLSTGDPESVKVRGLAARLGIHVLAKPFGVEELREAVEAIR
jgi:CheY-like chemotaxis protein